ncbi:hypothetical protein GIB67_037609 [Kingdonia uniflora]|uniref:Uncharacterized protein n=1 Tax=Kingdonia uniflora TaxID=39325 RepID=A0A7J7LSE4_9MAGN|nr:hypothetical protein GIB67_037609 [Kingdonia uniflora]
MDFFTKDEIGSLPGAKVSSTSSLRVSFSRSPSRLSFQDEFDDFEFSCPYDDITDLVGDINTDALQNY